jgi:hypothetical protein
MPRLSFSSLVLLAALMSLVWLPRGAVPTLRAAEPCQFTGVARVVAIGDVHGAYDRFVEILRAARIVDDRLKWIGGRTHLVQLGDVVDRGPDSARALDLLEQLEERASREGGAVHALLGNHEVMRMLGDLRFATAGEYNAFVSRRSKDLRDAYVQRLEALGIEAGDPPPLGFVEMLSDFGSDGRYGKRLRTLNTVVQINGTVFVHGGISPAAADRPCEAINEQVRRELTSDYDKTTAAPLESLAARPDGPLWYRGLADGLDAAGVDRVLAGQKARAVVVAHTVTSNGRIQTRFGGKVVMIDTGMQPAYVTGGRASALEITDGVMTAIYADRRDALDAAPAAASSPR